MGRYKALIGPRLRARGFAAQQTEAAVGVAVLKATPKNYRFKVALSVGWDSSIRGGTCQP
jgi:hypothetical protein